ncbi:MAG: hypothetical protein KatS3mg118_1134 [Paracoccaceae bacterium]|nr:MAG: hypothetical protein KatS3mg118_1134 [Paracoccaceae bacterium]
MEGGLAALVAVGLFAALMLRMARRRRRAGRDGARSAQRPDDRGGAAGDGDGD